MSFLRFGSRCSFALILVCGLGGEALAQPDEEESAEVSEDTDVDDADTTEEEASDGESDDMEDAEGATPEDKPNNDKKYDPKETDTDTYTFVGMRFRNFIVPKFMIDLFAEGGRTVNVFSAGPELSVRKSGFELDFAITTPWADYSMPATIIKGNGDPDEDYERIVSELKVLYLTVDLLKDIPITGDGRFSFLIGGGVGLGGVFGDLYRSQVYPRDPNNINPDDPDQWVECTAGQNDPVAPSGVPYCDDDGPFAGDTEPSWANGGSKPFIMPYLALPHLAFRAKPIKQLQTRVDAGFSLTGFFFGLAAGYALP